MTLEFIADENIPNSVIKKLREQGYIIFSIRENKKGIKDEEIIQLSIETQKPILTMDKDFGYLTFHLKQHPYCVILLRILPLSPDMIYTTIKNMLDQIINQNFNLKNKFIVSDGKTMRIRKF
jgi:predicted nuclease of predicted toxin-antitoxin system